MIATWKSLQGSLLSVMCIDILINSDNDIYIIKCQCGWQFLSLNQHEKLCPQCRKDYCKKCGKTIKQGNYCKDCLTKKDVYCPVCDKEKENYSKPFCDYCERIEKKIIRQNMSKRIKRIKTFKETQERCIYNYDCANCPAPDCLLPVDD